LYKSLDSWGTATRYGILKGAYLKQDMEKVEKVQRRATKMTSGIQGFELPGQAEVVWNNNTRKKGSAEET